MKFCIHQVFYFILIILYFSHKGHLQGYMLFSSSNYNNFKNDAEQMISFLIKLKYIFMRTEGIVKDFICYWELLATLHGNGCFQDIRVRIIS